MPALGEPDTRIYRYSGYTASSTEESLPSRATTVR